MEERVQAAGDGNNNVDPPTPNSPPSSPREPPLPLPLPPGKSQPPDDHNLIHPLPGSPTSQTYVVQIPRNQVYRVPPPENSKIVESHKQPNPKTDGYYCCLWLFSTIVVFGIAIAISFGIIHLLYKPKLPEFAITNFTVKQPPNPHAKLGYTISFNVENPNERMDVSYGGNGYGLLSFNHHKVADGKFSSFSQEAKKSKNLHLTLKGANITLPSEMEKSMNSTKLKKEVSLGFKIFVSTKISSWAKTVKKEITVSCDFKVNSLAEGTRVVDQECSTRMQ